MPYISKKQTILTKVLEVAKRSENPGRQQLLLDIANHPEIVDYFYLDGLKVMVSVGNTAYHLGMIKKRYLKYLVRFKNHRIVSWKVTGMNNSAIEGYGSPKRQFVGFLGINLTILLSVPVSLLKQQAEAVDKN